jgi:ATP-dependent Lon protease
VENEDTEDKPQNDAKTALAKRQLVIREKDVEDYLEKKKINHDKIMKDAPAGVVTGLAWTQAGGEILFIETLFTKGSGKIILTGQLGDVMKESAQIAVSLVKSLYPDKAELFEKNDLHIHVPDGAVPKDGPSAGIALTTAISSLVNEKMINPSFAMTGEVSLRGVVKPIGGLPEKLMAAQRAGISTVLIPEENQDDLREVADEVKEKLQIIPVSSVKEVLDLTIL